MPRGGGRFGGRGKQQGPEHWEDEEPAPTLNANRPAPTFPEVSFLTPKPLDHTEVAAVNRYLNLRTRARNGPFFAHLDPSTLTNEKGKVTPRVGFDPFNDQEGYASRFQKKKRTVPDVMSHDFALQFFPKELWPALDPKRRHPLWQTVDPAEFGEIRPRKRKRRLSAAGAEGGEETAERGDDSGDESDAINTGRRKHNAERSRRADREQRQRRGLDAEDDFPEGERDPDEEGDGEDEPQDSEFDESEDEDNDYNAEQYFDDGDDDGNDDDGGNDDYL